MRLIYARYNPQCNSIDVTTFENVVLRIDCNKAEEGLRTTPGSQCSLNALAIDNPCTMIIHGERVTALVQYVLLLRGYWLSLQPYLQVGWLAQSLCWFIYY